jgi:hypothetical protein
MGTEETEWTDAEREALDRLPRNLDPGRMLEERTVAELKRRGLLRDPAARVGGRPRLHPAWWAAGIAAALALFFGGLAAGQARSGISADDLVAALRSAEAADRPSLIQQTGSLYVESLAGLTFARQDPETVGIGVEVGLAALYAATYEMARLYPDDPRFRQVLEALEASPIGDSETDTQWF